MNNIYQDLDSIITELSQQGWSLSKNYNRYGDFEVLSLDDGSLINYPKPLFSPLFRGQTGWYDPCLPTMYRQNPSDTEILISKIKVNEFESLIRKHPQVQLDIENGYTIDFTGIAQHYSLKTEYLDITNSLPVAAFFATNEFNDLDESFQPITDSSKIGVLYFFVPTLLLSNHSDHNIFPIGFQPFRRPAEQRAFYIQLKQNADLNKIPGVFSFRFFQKRTISERLNEIMEGGKILFPYDVISVKAKEIIRDRKLSKNSVNNVFQTLNLDYDIMILERKLTELGYEIIDEEIYSFTKQDIDLSLQGFNSNLGNNSFSSRLYYGPSDETNTTKA